jgi:nucleoside-diphosphate-sugar epimerase
MSSLIIGCGYLGRRVAQLCQDEGDEVAVVTRSSRRGAELVQAGFPTLVADVTRPETLDALPAARRVVFCVGFAGNHGLSRRQVHVAGLAAVLDRIAEVGTRFVFVSTTGVLGDAAGAWVDDTTPCRPTRAAGRAFLEAEQTLRRYRCAEQSAILRMAGLYGPGRVARLDEIRAGRPLEVAAANYMNVIHVEDAARMVLAAWNRAKTPETYLVSDGQPVYRRDFYRYLAKVLDAPAPRFVEPAPETAMERHDATNKRVDSRRVLADLGVPLVYPSYREGLASILRPEDGKERG